MRDEEGRQLGGLAVAEPSAGEGLPGAEVERELERGAYAGAAAAGGPAVCEDLSHRRTMLDEALADG